MLRLRAFRPTQDKVVKLLLHPTYPWLVTADASDNVVVWDWEHRQVCLSVYLHFAPLFLSSHTHFIWEEDPDVTMEF